MVTSGVLWDTVHTQCLLLNVNGVYFQVCTSTLLLQSKWIPRLHGVKAVVLKLLVCYSDAFSIYNTWPVSLKGHMKIPKKSLKQQLCPTNIMCARVSNCMLVSASVGQAVTFRKELSCTYLSCRHCFSICLWLVFSFWVVFFFPLWIVCFLESAVFQHQYCQTNPCYLSQKIGAGSVGQQWYLQHCTVLICGSSVLLSWRSFASHGDVQYYQTCKTEYLYSNTYTPKNGQDRKEENSLGIFLSLLL